MKKSNSLFVVTSVVTFLASIGYVEGADCQYPPASAEAAMMHLITRGRQFEQSGLFDHIIVNLKYELIRQAARSVRTLDQTASIVFCAPKQIGKSPLVKVTYPIRSWISRDSFIEAAATCWDRLALVRVAYKSSPGEFFLELITRIPDMPHY